MKRHFRFLLFNNAIFLLTTILFGCTINNTPDKGPINTSSLTPTSEPTATAIYYESISVNNAKDLTKLHNFSLDREIIGEMRFRSDNSRLIILSPSYQRDSKSDAFVIYNLADNGINIVELESKESFENTISKDGKFVITYLGDKIDGKIRIYETVTGALSEEYNVGSAVNVWFNHDGTFAILQRQESAPITFEVYDFFRKEIVTDWIIEESLDYKDLLVFNEDQSRVWILGMDYCYLVDVTLGEIINKLNPDDYDIYPEDFVFIPKSEKLLLTGQGYDLKSRYLLWIDWSSNLLLNTWVDDDAFGENDNGYAYTMDFHYFSLFRGKNWSNGYVQILDGNTGAEIITLEGNNHTAFNPDGSLFAVGKYDTGIFVYDTSNWKKITTLYWLMDEAFYPGGPYFEWNIDGSLFASGYGEKRIAIWGINP